MEHTSFTKSGSKVEMLWQLKSHHSHLRSEKFELGSGRLQLSLKNYELLTFFAKSRPVEGYLPMVSPNQNKGFLFLYFRCYRDLKTALEFEGASFQNRTIHVHPRLSHKRGGGYEPWSRCYAKHNAQGSL